MFSKSFLISSLLCAVSYVAAAPAAVQPLTARQTITTLTSAQISSYKPYTWFASTAYCKPDATLAWNCGANCNANADFVPLASGGDGSKVQYWYVGWSPSLASVIVAHQGTSGVAADLTDLNIGQTNLDSSLFPGISSSIKTHSGFASAQANTATTILAKVKSAITTYKATKVTIIGHSLGGAIALLDGVYLPLHISGVTFKVVAYGLPRVGNQAFADYVDANVSITRINNKKDPVPILPGRTLGFHHCSGEIHISSSNTWNGCPGQDNTSSSCSTGAVANLLVGTTSDHMGPYDGVTLGC